MFLSKLQLTLLSSACLYFIFDKIIHGGLRQTDRDFQGQNESPAQPSPAHTINGIKQKEGPHPYSPLKNKIIINHAKPREQDDIKTVL